MHNGWTLKILDSCTIRPVYHANYTVSICHLAHYIYCFICIFYEWKNDYFCNFSFQVSAYDPDCNGNSQVSYHLANMSHSSIDVFNIGPTSGRLCVAKTLDYETQKIYEFPVYATDSGKINICNTCAWNICHWTFGKEHDRSVIKQLIITLCGFFDTLMGTILMC